MLENCSDIFIFNEKLQILGISIKLNRLNIKMSKDSAASSPMKLLFSHVIYSNPILI